MAIATVEQALDEEATRVAVTIRAADAEAIAYLQTVIADATIPAALKQRLQGEVAYHNRCKQDQAAEV